MAELYPEIEPYGHGLLDVGDGHRVYWETCGNPDGKPAVVLHGGPGQGCAPRMRRSFDPQRYRVVLFDQRGCGRSTPHAADPDRGAVTANTTAHLIADMELLREHLGIERWLVNGGSWGSTLGLAYAERHPERVSEIVLVAITTTRRAETDWLYRGAGRFFPEAWERFRDGVPEAERERVTAAEGAHELLAAYARLLEDPDPDVRRKATNDWATWEDAVVALEPGGKPDMYSGHPDRELAAMVRICAHYFSNGAWLEDDALLRDAGRLAGIPGVLVHGRLDMSGPPDTAWELVKRWPDAELHILDVAGHQASPARRELVLAALDRFARA
jgi:proline iminopeptidase